jgi:hypothetical protein
MDAVDRPDMPAGYGIAADDSGELAFGWVEQQLAAARNYWVVTTRADGQPHAMPVWGLWLDGAVLFSTDPESAKARNLAARPDAVVHLESGDDVVIVEGTVVRLNPSELPESFVEAYREKYAHVIDTANPAFGFYRLRPTQVLAWRESDFTTSATRFRSYVT